jgi:hypothetical protein
MSLHWQQEDHSLIEMMMKRLDDGKVSLVEFLNSIKFAPTTTHESEERTTPFAHFNPRTRGGQALNVEERQLIRSAN